jgi:hypothetical protein
MSYRFDNRSVGTFKKDIFFATHIEKYFFNKFLDICDGRNDITITNAKDNGVDNDGAFIASGKTSGADYRVDIDYDDFLEKDHPLEVKWVPTAGKLTLKTGDLKSYIKEDASILFIYNSVNCGTNLKKPKDYDLEKHIKLLDSKSQQIKWGIMLKGNVKKFLSWHEKKNLVKPIYYMGNKLGIILNQKDFNKWFTVEDWE